jgi:serine/threonine protein kinase
VAVKTLHKQILAGYQEAVLMGFLRREMATMRELHHENVVEWFHTLETCTHIYTVLEFSSGGTVSVYIKKNNGISEDQVQLVFVQLLSAIFYMHSKSVLYTVHSPQF